jgi:hypothetical protein
MGKTRKDALRYGTETKDRQSKRQVDNKKANKAFKRLMEEDEDFEDDNYWNEWEEDEDEDL